ncbi:Wzz/FepE/Etk N-terminal domain-containing protein [Colwellia hornerae]|uniref:LPS O-antigen length regulator n=2 Tax=Colwellia hornerae TaxID=89402 RepID=A0A5C6QJQ5_9GAMM|nr:Wzz/FepE/Etk N-terminal domain-containing protein [Colwellia hornerae]TWX54040.1 LPS O-antigen length regulator [Colwellia hornerae]TWX60815.1 LPS O-antigen length regulator [Colwellia hornerae]TWX69145.1 LPS O-antigen length regulator [Colwellia hornerae]
MSSTMPNDVNYKEHFESQDDDEIDLGQLWRAIWAGKIVIMVISFIFAVASVTYALSKPDIYKASVLLSPTASEGGGGLAGLSGQFGGLASLAGINLGGSGGDKTTLALEIIKSRSFIETFISKHNLLVPLMAAKKWNISNDELIYDKDLYDIDKNKWLREVKAPKKVEPSPWESFKAFSKLLSVSQDKATSMVTIELSFFSPNVAKQWLIWLVEDLNNFVREQDQQNSQNSIDYLTKQLEKTQVTNMETVFYQLIEEQTKNMMLTQVNKEYVLKTIDPAQVPDRKDQPKRALIVVLGTILGGILSVIIVLIRYFSNSNYSTKVKEEKLA